MGVIFIKTEALEMNEELMSSKKKVVLKVISFTYCLLISFIYCLLSYRLFRYTEEYDKSLSSKSS